MLVSRRVDDAAAAVCSGGGVILIALGVKPIPAAISYLGFMAYAWGILMALGSLAAATGAILRTRNIEAERRRYVSVALERSAWPLIAGCALAFCVGVVHQFGLVDAALTLGWTGFVIFTCVGHWRDLHTAARLGQ